MVIDEQLREFILNGASTSEIKKKAILSGMDTLRSSALSRLKEGIISVEEVLRVTASDD
jgi:type IV pilus assembly protein PilB